MLKIDLISQRFGRLVTVSECRSGGRVAWVCDCDCGNQTIAKSHELRGGTKDSCGCAGMERLSELARKRNFRHGHNCVGRQSRTHKSWVSMLSRCRDKNHTSYPDYGGRGISVCDRWHQYENFLHDMGERPAGTSIDRIDNDKGYEPGNCRWATRSEQQRNKRDKSNPNGLASFRRTHPEILYSDVHIFKLLRDGLSFDEIAARYLRRKVGAKC